MRNGRYRRGCTGVIGHGTQWKMEQRLDFDGMSELMGGEKFL